MSKWRNLRIGSIWERENDKGTFFTGKAGCKETEKTKGVRLFAVYEDGSSEEITNISIFPNKYKELDTHPDFVLSASFPTEE